MKNLILAILFLFPSICHADITSNLADYWKLDNGSGTTATDSVGSHNGTFGGTVNPTWVAGFDKNAVLFTSSSSNYISTGNLGITSTPITMCAWFTTGVTSGAVLGITDNTTTNKYILIQANSTSTKISGAVRNATDNSGNQINIDSTQVISNGKWHFVCFVMTSTTSRDLYVDGAAAIHDSTSYTFPSTFNDSRIGALPRSTPSAFFNGQIDEVRVYTRALSSSEVTQLYQTTYHNGSQKMTDF